MINKKDYLGEVLYFKRAQCYECSYLNKALDNLKSDYNISVKEVNMDIDFGTTDEYVVTRTPTLVFLKNGFEVNRIEKLVSEQAIERVIKNYF